MVALAVLLNHHTWTSLSFHPDFSFYYQFTSRLADTRLSNQYPFSPNGINWLGWSGPDGANSLHESVHFEPIKYIYPLLYLIYPGPYSIFSFIALIYFAPLFYIHFVFRSRDQLDSIFKWLTIGIYCAYPSVLTFLIFDIRPFILLVPFWLMAFLSIHCRRPPIESFLLFNLIFLVREESIIFGACLLLYTFFRNGTSSRVIKPLLYSWFFWTPVTLLYFNHTSLVLQLSPTGAISRFIDITTNPLSLLIISISLVLLAVISIRQRSFFKTYLPLASFSLILIPTFYPYAAAYFQTSFPAAQQSLLFSSPWTLGVMSLLMTVIIIWSLIKTKYKRQLFLVLFSLLFCSVLFTTIFSEHSQLHNIPKHAQKTTNHSWLIDISKQLDPYRNTILTDYSPYPLFASYENVYLYHRLPLNIIPGDARDWPTNMPVLKKLLREDVNYIVMLKEELKNSGLTQFQQDNWEQIQDDGNFIVIKINRDAL